MRAPRILVFGLGVAVVGAGVTGAVAGTSRSSAFAKESSALQARWRVAATEGVPANQFAALRTELSGSTYSSAAWWSPVWWSGSGQSVIDDLTARTDRIWSSALLAARRQADGAITGWRQLQAQLGSYLPSDLVAAAKTWPEEADQAGTPAELTRLAAQWNTTLVTARKQGLGAELDAQVKSLGGVQGVLRQADSAVQTARGINLDDLGIATLTGTLRSQIARDQDASATLTQLVSALAAFHQLLSLNNNVAGTLRPVLMAVDQAVAEGTPNSATYASQYRNLAAALGAARVAAELSSVAQQLSALQTNLTAELSNSQCGGHVPGGKVITIKLSVQEAVFYQDGCVVKATPVTTGRALLRTPTGTFHVFFKQSPFQFISPWPKTSPFYYFPSWVSWVMEFAGGGYFLHDAPWEPSSQYGPGSEDSSGASHGCVHIPTDVMRWAYQWTPTGTPVIITG